MMHPGNSTLPTASHPSSFSKINKNTIKVMAADENISMNHFMIFAMSAAPQLWMLRFFVS